MPGIVSKTTLGQNGKQHTGRHLPDPNRFTKRERQILDLLVFQGLNPKEIAGALDISISTVNENIVRAVDKAGVPSRWALVLFVIQEPYAVRKGVAFEQRGLHAAGCQCDSPYCVARRKMLAA